MASTAKQFHSCFFFTYLISPRQIDATVNLMNEIGFVFLFYSSLFRILLYYAYTCAPNISFSFKCHQYCWWFFAFNACFYHYGLVSPVADCFALLREVAVRWRWKCYRCWFYFAGGTHFLAFLGNWCSSISDIFYIRMK